MATSDYYSGSALSGAGGGAAAGALVGSEISPGYGTLAGGLIGGALGLFGGASANQQRNNAVNKQASNIDQVMANMRQLSTSSYDNYLAGLKKAQSFYGPSMEAWNRAYGKGDGTGLFPTTQQLNAGAGVTTTGVK